MFRKEVNYFTSFYNSYAKAQSQNSNSYWICAAEEVFIIKSKNATNEDGTPDNRIYEYLRFLSPNAPVLTS